VCGYTATDERLPDVAAIVRKTDPESLLETIDRVASVKAVRDTEVAERAGGGRSGAGRRRPLGDKGTLVVHQWVAATLGLA